MVNTVSVELLNYTPPPINISHKLPIWFSAWHSENRIGSFCLSPRSILLAVRRRLGERNPFLLYSSSFCSLFVQGGNLSKKNVESIPAPSLCTLWAIADADLHLDGVPE